MPCPSASAGSIGQTLVPVIRFHLDEANAAFAVHAALAKAEAAEPGLADNEHWREQREIAFARFNAAFCAGK